MIDQLKHEIAGRKFQVSMLDDRGNLTDSCHTLLDLKEWLGRPLHEIHPMFEGLQEGILAMGEGDPAFTIPLVSFSLSGKEFDLSMEFFRQKGVPGTVWVVTNNEEFKNKLRLMQQERNDSMILLETIRIQKKQLSEANERLQALNDGLDRFAYIVSHDLKSPLRAIGTLADWIDEGIESGDLDEVAEHLALLKKRAQRMEGLIEGILQYSRAGRTQMEKLPIDTNLLVREILDSDYQDGSVRLIVPEPLPQLMAARTSLYQVFSNLISNAVKYTDKEVPEITISATEAEDRWEFRVADNGPGIDPRHHQRIFEIFATLQSRDSYESTGIGLTIVQKIVEDLGGKIRVESEPGNGATFIFTWLK